MKVIYSIATILFLFSSCGVNEEKPVEKNEEVIVLQDTVVESLPVYNSKIRKEAPIQVGEIYIDTLTFLSFDSDYDYWFGLFLTKQLDTVFMVYYDIIEENNNGREMVLRWEVDSLYEAGEGDELYYQERIISYEVNRGLEEEFEIFLNVFVADFVDLGKDMTEYIYKEIGFYSSINPGVYCVLNPGDPSAKLVSFLKNNTVFDSIPPGNFCEGYSNISDGFYFEGIAYDALPVFQTFDDNGDLQEAKYKINEKLLSNKMMRVNAIKSEYHWAYFFFIQIENKWYFFAQDLCDCSA